MKLVDWTYNDKPITSVKDMPTGVVGFIYRLVFDDGTKYVGKKNLYSVRVLKALKTGKQRENSIQFYRNVKGKRVLYEKVKKESNWKTYKSSSDKAKSKLPVKREILAYGISNMNLTYLETKYLFSLGCLETDEYLNDNILGKFYRTD